MFAPSYMSTGLQGKVSTNRYQFLNERKSMAVIFKVKLSNIVNPFILKFFAQPYKTPSFHARHYIYLPFAITQRALHTDYERRHPVEARTRAMMG